MPLEAPGMKTRGGFMAGASQHAQPGRAGGGRGGGGGGGAQGGQGGRGGGGSGGGDGSGAWHQHPAHMSAQLQYLAAVVVLHAVGREAVAPPGERDGLVRTHAL